VRDDRDRSRLARKPEEPWLARWLVLAVIAKLIASILRYRSAQRVTPTPRSGAL
jgi:hypothetical protein